MKRHGPLLALSARRAHQGRTVGGGSARHRKLIECHGRGFGVAARPVDNRLHRRLAEENCIDTRPVSRETGQSWPTSTFDLGSCPNESHLGAVEPLTAMYGIARRVRRRSDCREAGTALRTSSSGIARQVVSALFAMAGNNPTVETPNEDNAHPHDNEQQPKRHDDRKPCATRSSDVRRKWVTTLCRNRHPPPRKPNRKGCALPAYGAPSNPKPPPRPDVTLLISKAE